MFQALNNCTVFNLRRPHKYCDANMETQFGLYTLQSRNRPRNDCRNVCDDGGSGQQQNYTHNYRVVHFMSIRAILQSR